MKITPLEIRQKDFEKKLRGYDKDEVTAFLLSLSNEWERVLDENKELSIKLKQAEKEVEKLREVESSLFKTLKTAEDTGANLIDQANKAAELHMKETQMKAEALMSEAKSKAKAMMEKAEVEARQIIEELQEAVKGIEQNHRDIENHRQNAIAELKNLSVDLIEKVERTSKANKEFKFDDYVRRVKELARESGERIKSENTELNMPEAPKLEVPPKEEPKETAKEEPVEPLVAEAPEVEEKPEPPKSETLETEPKKEEKEEPQASAPEVMEEPESQPEQAEVEEDPEESKENEPDPEPVSEEMDTTDELEEKKGPRIARTVSFFDELDDND